MAVAQITDAVKIPSKKSTAGATSPLSQASIAKAARSRLIF
jgi:hypothetical protein